MAVDLAEAMGRGLRQMAIAGTGGGTNGRWMVQGREDRVKHVVDHLFQDTGDGVEEGGLGRRLVLVFVVVIVIVHHLIRHLVRHLVPILFHHHTQPPTTVSQHPHVFVRRRVRLASVIPKLQPSNTFVHYPLVAS